MEAKDNVTKILKDKQPTQRIFKKEFYQGKFTTHGNNPTDPLNNKNLSNQARGMLWLMLSQHPCFNITEGWLISQSTDGRLCIRNTLKELESHGHVTFSMERVGGKFSSKIITVHEEPLLRKNTVALSVSKSSPCAETARGVHRVRKTDAVNRTLINTNNKQILGTKKRSSTNNRAREEDFFVASASADIEPTRRLINPEAPKIAATPLRGGRSQNYSTQEVKTSPREDLTALVASSPDIETEVVANRVIAYHEKEVKKLHSTWDDSHAMREKRKKNNFKVVKDALQRGWAENDLLLAIEGNLNHRDPRRREAYHTIDKCIGLKGDGSDYVLQGLDIQKNLCSNSSNVKNINRVSIANDFQKETKQRLLRHIPAQHKMEIAYETL